MKRYLFRALRQPLSLGLLVACGLVLLRPQLWYVLAIVALTGALAHLVVTWLLPRVYRKR